MRGQPMPTVGSNDASAVDDKKTEFDCEILEASTSSRKPHKALSVKKASKAVDQKAGSTRKGDLDVFGEPVDRDVETSEESDSPEPNAELLRYKAEIDHLNKRFAEQQERAKSTEDRALQLEKKIASNEELMRETDVRARTQAENCKSLSQKVEELENLLSTTRKKLRELEIHGEDLSSKLSVATASVESLEKEKTNLEARCNALKVQLEKTEEDLASERKTNATLQIESGQAGAKIKVCEDEKSRLSLRLIKEREQFKIKLAELRRENEMHKATIKQLQKDHLRLSAVLTKQEAEHREEQENLSNSFAHQLESAIKTSTTELAKKHEEALQSVLDTLSRTRAAYSELEQEFRRGIEAEKARFNDLLAEHHDAVERLQDQSQRIAATAAAESELKSMVKELSNAVKKQQSKIGELDENNRLALVMLEEKGEALEEKLKVCQRLKERLNECQAQSKSFESQLQNALDEKAKLGEKVRTLEITVTDCQRLVKELETEKTKLLKEHQNDEQALRVKNKMLDDQNETIRTLKQNLENKNREYQSVQADTAKREEFLEEQLSLQKNASEDLHNELEAQEKAITHLQTVVADYREERDRLRKEVSDLSRKLKDRNESIFRIEEEVAKVRKVFKLKEEKLIEERDALLRKRNDEVEELKHALETQTARVAVWDRERQAMIQSIKRLQKELDATATDKERHDAEMQVVLLELEKQKQIHDERLHRIRAVFSDI
ncbi:leucine rich repeat [Quaeritorhiza haematococci]|nr:leucine rich repeat [Quaeritorhiza haematococci]